MNEFTANDRLLYRSFPTLFMFGIGIQSCCGLGVDDRHHLLLEAVEELQDDINRAQAEDQQEDTAKEFDGICAALQGFLLDHHVGNHAAPCHGSFVHDLEDDKQYAGGDDIYAHAQHIADGIKPEDEFLGDPSMSTPSSTTIDKGDQSQEAILRTIIEYVHLDARSDVSCNPTAPLLLVQTRGGPGKSWMACAILKWLCGQYGNNVVKYVAPCAIAVKNLNNGSTCHHGMGLKVYDTDEVDADVENKRATFDRLRRSFAGCKVLVVDEVSMVGCGMLREIDAHLREICQRYDVPFRALCSLLLGHFIQLELVANIPLHASIKCQPEGQNLAHQEKGLELFGLFHEVCLTKQHRATDPEHAQVNIAFRQWTKDSMGICKKFLLG